MASEARSCGWLLCAGLVVFLVGAVVWRPALFQAPLLSDQLKNVAAHRVAWLWIHAWLAAGVVVTTAALSVWVELQRQSGERLATPIAFTIYLVGAVLWLAAMAMRITVQEWAARQAVEGVVPDIYPSIHRLGGLLYAVHMVLSYAAFVALGAGVLRSGIIGRGLGWGGVVGGGGFFVGFLALGGGPFAPPFLAHVYTFALGVALLRAR